MKLDKNGYAQSILQDDTDCCFCCMRNGYADPLNRHEVFGGAYREKSKRLGLWVMLCHHRCHQGPNGVHSNVTTALALKKIAQSAAMQQFGWTVEDFISEFGKNYL